DAHLVGHRLVDHGAEDDVGVVFRLLLDERRRLVHLVQAQVRGARDVDEHAARPRDREVLEERARDRLLRGLDGPVLARRDRGAPTLHGLVTTPTVSEPSSFATLAMTGAAPVPVPPPMPAVMKIMSASARYSRRRSTSSWAARLPTSGLPPAPSPRVSFSPSCILIGARLALRACESVLAAMKSTPGKPAAIMVFTALPPPPPTPPTLLRAAPPASTHSI